MNFHLRITVRKPLAKINWFIGWSQIKCLSSQICWPIKMNSSWFLFGSDAPTEVSKILSIDWNHPTLKSDALLINTVQCKCIQTPPQHWRGTLSEGNASSMDFIIDFSVSLQGCVVPAGPPPIRPRLGDCLLSMLGPTCDILHLSPTRDPQYRAVSQETQTHCSWVELTFFCPFDSQIFVTRDMRNILYSQSLLFNNETFTTHEYCITWP